MREVSEGVLERLTLGNGGKVAEKSRIIKGKIISNKKIAADHYVLEVEENYIREKISPGQFIMIKAQDAVYDPLLRMPFGVHSIGRRNIRILYKVVGKGTEILSRREKGETLDMLGPLGKGFDCGTGKTRQHVFMIAGGHGIAPLYGLAETLAGKNKRIDFFTGACTKKHLVCVEDLKKLGVNVRVATEDGSKGFKGYVTDLVTKHLRRSTINDQRSTIYACGPKPMLAEVAHLAKKLKIKAQLSLDEYMACGIGACLGCAVPAKTGGYKLVCKDGPVFDAEEIDWGHVHP